MQSGRLPLVALQQAAKSFLADDLVLSNAHDFRWRIGLLWWSVTEPLVRAFFVVVDQVFADQVSQVSLTEHEEMVQTLLLDPLHPGFRERVHVGRAWRNWSKLDPFRINDRTELLCVLPVSVPNNVLGQCSSSHSKTMHKLRPCSVIHAPSGLFASIAIARFPWWAARNAEDTTRVTESAAF